MAKSSKIKRLLNQQAVLAEFGSFAFRSADLQDILDKTASICATYLDTPYCKVCCFRPRHNDLLIVAGCGWKPDVVGKAVSKADSTSPGGRAFVTGKPVICSDLSVSEGFVLPSFYAQHGIVSTVNVVIQGSNGDAAYGILEIDSPVARKYEQDDIHFLTSFANVLAEAVATTHRIERLRIALDEKEMLARELQHRVRNNLHLISGMLTREADETSEAEHRFRTIASRVQSLAAVYDHLLGSGMAREMEFDKYLTSLCVNLYNFQPGNVKLVSNCSESVTVDLDTATAIGLAVTELITNSYKHAFPDGNGTIEVALNYQGQAAVISVQDDGVGISKAKISNRYGLGLVQRLVEQVDASIQIRQTPKGTRYEIELPLQGEAA